MCSAQKGTANRCKPCPLQSAQQDATARYSTTISALVGGGIPQPHSVIGASAQPVQPIRCWHHTCGQFDRFDRRTLLLNGCRAAGLSNAVLTT